MQLDTLLAWPVKHRLKRDVSTTDQSLLLVAAVLKVVEPPPVCCVLFATFQDCAKVCTHVADIFWCLGSHDGHVSDEAVGPL